MWSRPVAQCAERRNRYAVWTGVGNSAGILGGLGAGVEGTSINTTVAGGSGVTQDASDLYLRGG